MSRLRFLAKPAEALAACLPLNTPKASDAKDASSRINPVLRITGMLPPSMPLSINSAMSSGMMHSMTTSSDTYTGALMESALNSRTLLRRRLNMVSPPWDQF